MEVLKGAKQTPLIKGKSIISSTSKIKKINATRKNRKEKGNRPSLIVENPHSKGLRVSRLKKTFFLKKWVINSIIRPKINLTNKNLININILLSH